MSRSFDAIDDFIDCGSNASLDNLAAITIVCWVFPKSIGEGNVGNIVQKSNNQASGWRFAHAIDGVNLDFIVDYTTTDLIRRSTDTMSTGQWHSVAMSWDGSITATNCKLYINLTEVATYSISQNADGTRVSDAAEVLAIGRNVLGNNTYDGLIAFAQVFNRVLVLNEIIQCTKFPGSIRQGLVGFWPLWGTSSNEPDYSGNQNTGAVTGAIKGTSEPPINGIFQVPKPELTGIF